MSLYVTHAHPNPIGKDRTRDAPPTNEKPNEEWVQFRNVGSQTVELSPITLHHRTFDNRCNATGENRLMTFSGGLQAGYSIRAHTGTGTVWQEGEAWHLYAGKGNFVWNNQCGDQVILRKNGTNVVDWAGYDPNPPEGTVLRRIQGTNRLA